MKKIVCISLLTLAVSTANAATHKPGTYLKAGVGANFMSDSLVRKAVGTLPTFSLGVGYEFHNMFRTELEVRYKQKSGGVSITSNGTTLSLSGSIREIPIFLNAYYDINTNSMFTPYITAGLGGVVYLEKASINKTGNQSENKSQDGVAVGWNAGLGSKFQVNKDIDLDLCYKFIGIPVASGLLDSHAITIGLIWNL